MLSTDAIDFKLDLSANAPPGKLDLTGGRINLSSGAAGVLQAAMLAASQIKGEWFLDQSKGVPYVEYPGVVSQSEALLGTRYDAARFETAFRTVLQAVPGVVEVLLVNSARDSRTRKINARWQLRTSFGDTPLITTVH